jgi:hypothetical protein
MSLTMKRISILRLVPVSDDTGTTRTRQRQTLANQVIRR